MDNDPYDDDDEGVELWNYHRIKIWRGWGLNGN